MSTYAEETLHVTPERAETLFRSRVHYSRPVDQDWVRILAERMEGGEFSPHVARLIFGRVGAKGKLVLLNGQHILQAVKQTGKPLTIKAAFYTVDQESELRQMYATIDRSVHSTQRGRAIS